MTTYEYAWIHFVLGRLASNAGEGLVFNLIIEDSTEVADRLLGEFKKRFPEPIPINHLLNKLTDACKGMEKVARDILANDDPDSKQGIAAQNLLDVLKLTGVK